MQKAGAWYSYGEDRIGQGRDNARNYLKEHTDASEEIEAKIRAVKGIDGAEEDASTTDADTSTAKKASKAKAAKV